MMTGDLLLLADLIGGLTLVKLANATGNKKLIAINKWIALGVVAVGILMNV